MNWYKWIWSHTPINRPFTYCLRDIWHKLEGVCIVFLVAGGATICHFFGIKNTLIALGIFCLGYIAGHLFWGKEYQENQQGGQ